MVLPRCVSKITNTGLRKNTNLINVIGNSDSKCKMDVNKAIQRDVESGKGIGSAIAKQIIRYREDVGLISTENMASVHSSLVEMVKDISL